MPIGTTRVGHDGYLVVKVHPGAGHWRAEHLLVMEQILGRALSATEIVHHINLIRADNAPGNLHLCCDKSEHNKVHNSYDALLIGLMEDGIVRFNRDTGRYERNEALLPRRE